MAPFNRTPSCLRKLANGGICLSKLLFFFQVCPLFAILIGNPAQPAMQKEGIVRPASWWSVRIAYFEDYVYRQRFEDEFIDPELFHSKTFSRMTTDAGLITLNFWDKLDLYGILGGFSTEHAQAAPHNGQPWHGIPLARHAADSVHERRRPAGRHEPSA